MEKTMQKYIWIVFVIGAVGYFLTYVLAGHYVKGLKDPYEEDLEEAPQVEKPQAESLQVEESQLELPQVELPLETDKDSSGKTDT